jgi:hypothetical protein
LEDALASAKMFQMRRLLCFVFYALMIGSGGAGLIVVFLNYNGRLSIRFIGACVALLSFGAYLVWIDCLAPTMSKCLRVGDTGKQRPNAKSIS